MKLCVRMINQLSYLRVDVKFNLNSKEKGCKVGHCTLLSHNFSFFTKSSLSVSMLIIFGFLIDRAL